MIPMPPDTPRGIYPVPRRGAGSQWVWRYRVRWIDPGTGKMLVEELDPR